MIEAYGHGRRYRVDVKYMMAADIYWNIHKERNSKIFKDIAHTIDECVSSI